MMGGIRIYCYCIFHIDRKAKNHIALDKFTCFCLTVISHQSFSPFSSTSLVLFIFLPETVVHLFLKIIDNYFLCTIIKVACSWEKKLFSSFYILDRVSP